MGPERLLEAMRLARQAMSYIKTTPPQPSYLLIKQGRDESFASFVDRVSNSRNNSDVQEWMKGALLRQCIIENCNSATRSIIVTLPADAPVELMRDRMSRVPVGPHTMLVEAVKELGKDLAHTQNQAFAALAPLKGAEAPRSGKVCNKPMH